MSDAAPGAGVAAGPPAGGLHAAAARQSNAVHTNGRATPPSYGNAGPAGRGPRGAYFRSVSTTSTGASIIQGHHLPLPLLLGVLTTVIFIRVSLLTGKLLR